MPQTFHPRSNSLFRTALLGVPVVICLFGYGVWAVWWSPYMTRVDVALDQPVPFSHQHHVAGLGIDCRYCHVSVETSAFAGLPPTETCMTCHSQVWTDAPVLAPVRQSWAAARPLHWNRVHDLPDFVFFNHAIHIQRGIGCSTCHGQVDQMPLIWKNETLYMKWCLECHRDPTPYLRPADQIYNMDWKPGSNQTDRGEHPLEIHDIHPEFMNDCSFCHR